MIHISFHAGASAVLSVFSFVNLLRMSQWFYAVGRGRRVGVYMTWDECKKQVENIGNAKFRKFKTRKEADDFIQECLEKYSPLKPLPPTSRIISDSKSVPSASQPHSAQHSLASRTLFYSQPVTSTSSASVAPLQPVTLNSTSQFTTAFSPNADMSGGISPQTVAAIERMVEQDPFLPELSVGSTQSNVGFVTSNRVETNNMNHLVEIVEKHFSEMKTTLNKVLLRISNLENKVEELARQNTISNLNVEKQNDSGSTLKRSLLQSYNVPQPLGKRNFSTNEQDEIEVVPAPPKKIPKIEVNSDDEGDGFAHDFKVNEDGYVIVYTDGACEKNGRSGAKAGIGVWFGDAHPLNVSEPVQGRATNNTAEIQAVVQALEIAKRAGVRKIIVHTDSQFTINCITKWVHGWMRNHWKLASGGPVKNKDDLIVLLEAMKGLDVKWEHVRGHQGIRGNEMADRLARSGAERYQS